MKIDGQNFILICITIKKRKKFSIYIIKYLVSFNERMRCRCCEKISSKHLLITALDATIIVQF